jgi:hypothetical protein
MTFKTLSQAWAYIASAQVSQNSSIEIELQENYAETLSSSFSLNHPYGPKISIIGDNNGQAITFTNAGAGFTLDTGHSLADFEGLSVIGPSGGTNGAAAFQVTQNSCLAQLQNISIKNFDLGIFANTCATINSVQFVTFGQFKVGGVEADRNAAITMTGVTTVDGALTKGATPQFGFFANGGTIDCNGCTVKACAIDFYASQGGKLYAKETIASSPTGPKFYANYLAQDHSFIYAQGSTHAGAQCGFDCSQSGFIDAQDTGIPTKAALYDYIASKGGTIDANGHNGGSETTGMNDGSYVFGF